MYNRGTGLRRAPTWEYRTKAKQHRKQKTCTIIWMLSNASLKWSRTWQSSSSYYSLIPKHICPHAWLATTETTPTIIFSTFVCLWASCPLFKGVVLCAYFTESQPIFKFFQKLSSGQETTKKEENIKITKCIKAFKKAGWCTAHVMIAYQCDMYKTRQWQSGKCQGIAMTWFAGFSN